MKVDIDVWVAIVGLVVLAVIVAVICRNIIRVKLTEDSFDFGADPQPSPRPFLSSEQTPLMKKESKKRDATMQEKSS